jgi:hypothetical protein
MEKRCNFALVLSPFTGDPACSSTRVKLSADVRVITGAPAAAVAGDRKPEGRGICSLALLSLRGNAGVLVESAA